MRILKIIASALSNITTYITIIIVLFSFFGCKPEQKQSSTTSVDRNTNITDNRVSKPGTVQNPSDYQELMIDENKLFIPISSDKRVLQVVNANLDLDLSDEQIIVYKNKNKQDSHLKIMVVDFDSIRNTYFRSWKTETNAVNSHDFTVGLNDIVGDHNLEIILQGTNEKGELTLDVFRRTSSPNGLGLLFTNICKIVSNGTIEINEMERSESYQLGQKNGISFPIVVYTHDPESDNIMDLLKMTYYWKYPQNSYVLSSVQKIPGKKVEEKRLEKLFKSNSTKAFEDFITGPWYHSQKGKEGEILLFQPETKEINFFAGSVEESYRWRESSSKIYNRLRIVAENEFIPSIRKTISVRVRSLYELDVSIQGKDRWDFSSKRYIRLPEKVQNEMLSNHGKRFIKLLSVPLKGLYKNDSHGIEITFNPPYFEWHENNDLMHGGFTIFSIVNSNDHTQNNDIAEFMFIDKNGIVRKIIDYQIDFTEKRTGKELRKTLTMQKVNILANRIEPLNDENIKLIQIEFINNDKQKND